MRGWGANDDHLDQIEQTVLDRLALARENLNQIGREECEDCERPIPLARRKVHPSAVCCVQCQEERDGTAPKFIQRTWA